MITGIQITKAANDDLLKLFLVAGQRKKGEARLHRCEKQVFAEDESGCSKQTG